MTPDAPAPEPFTVKAVPGTTPPGFTAVPEKWWVEIKGGTPDERKAAVDRAVRAAKEAT